MNWVDWLKSKFESASDAGIDPEADWVVTISEVKVTCVRPDGFVESVGWDDLKEVVIATTDEGPFAADVMWLLIGEESGCIVPQGAKGEDELLRKLQTLAGFNNEAVIEAMGSTSNRKFVCWEKEPTASV